MPNMCQYSYFNANIPKMCYTIVMKKESAQISRRSMILRMATALLFILALSMLIRDDSISGVNWDEYISSTISFQDGTILHSDNEFPLLDSGDVAELKILLPKDALLPDSRLCFSVEQCVVEVYYRDRLLYSAGKENAERGKMIGTQFVQVAVPDSAWGEHLNIKLTVTENNAFSSVGNFYMYSADDAYRYFYSLDPSGFLAQMTCLCMCFIIFFVVLLEGRSLFDIRRGAYLSIAMFCSALWISTQNGQLALLYPNGSQWVEYVNLYFMPLPLLMYLYEGSTIKHEKRLIFYVFCGNAGLLVLASVLHLTDVLHYCAILPVAHLMFFIDIILLVALSVESLRRNTGSAFYMAAGFSALSVCAGIDLLNFDLIKYMDISPRPPDTHFFSMGALFFLVSMLLSYFSDMSDERTRTFVLSRHLEDTKALLADIPAGICVFQADSEMRIVGANEFFYSIFGYTKSSAAQAGFDSFLFPVEPGERSRLIEREELKSRGELFPETEIDALTASGAHIKVLARSTYDPSSNLVTANVLDITERQAFREQLRINQESYMLALRQSGKAFISLDVPGRTLHLSDAIAPRMNVPTEIPDFPDCLIDRGFITERSVADMRKVAEDIFSGIPSGSVRLLCRRPSIPKKNCWLLCSYSTVCGSDGAPLISIITYEDISGLHQREIDAAFRQTNLVGLSPENYVIAEYNVTLGSLLRSEGELYNRQTRLLPDYDSVLHTVLPLGVAEENVADMRKFLSRERLIKMFASGICEDSIEYRTRGSEAMYRRLSVQLIADPFGGDVLAQFFFRNIDEQRSSEIALRNDVDALKRELENSRIRVMINQIQPHFLYNSLSSIRVITKRDPDYAYDLLYDFTTYLRSSIKALSSNKLVSFSEELKNVKAYLNIEKMRFMDALSVSYDIKCDEFLVAPLSIQPFAENAVRHGVYPRGDIGGSVSIRSYETLDDFVVEIVDDGVGFDVSAALAEGGEHIGLKNTIFRIETLMGALVKIESIAGAGTTVRVLIPKSSEE